MRVWDIPPNYLCDKHLLGQHLEIHTMHSVIINGKKGYAKHPETMRWRGHEDELRGVHEATAKEMITRGFNHKSPLAGSYVSQVSVLGIVDPIWRQIEELRRKYCNCNIEAIYQWYDLVGKQNPTEVDSDIDEI